MRISEVSLYVVWSMHPIAGGHAIEVVPSFPDDEVTDHEHAPALMHMIEDRRRAN